LSSGTDVRQHRTYTWGPADTQPPAIRLDNNRFFHERIQTDVERVERQRVRENDAGF
jgi:hypothetical protein